MSIEIVNGRVFVEGRENVSPMEIGYAVLDAAEENQNAVLYAVSDKGLMSIINNQGELTALNSWLNEVLLEFEDKICNHSEKRPFSVNLPSSDILFNLVTMIKNGSLVFTENTTTQNGLYVTTDSKTYKSYRCACGGIIGPMGHTCR